MKTPARSITTILGGAALFLATAGMAGAQETAPETPRKQAQTQARKADDSGQGQTRGAQNQTGATRKLGPGGGAGSQVVRPQDGTGNGSPGQIGAGKGHGKGKARGNGNSDSRTSGSGKGTLSRSRSRSQTASGTCSGARSGRGSRGSRGSGGGGRR